MSNGSGIELYNNEKEEEEQAEEEEEKKSKKCSRPCKQVNFRHLA